MIPIGKKDIQVDWQVDGPIFEGIANEQSNIAIAYAEDANHVLKYEPRSRDQLTAAEVTASDNADDVALVPESLEIIKTWLGAQI